MRNEDSLLNNNLLNIRNKKNRKIQLECKQY